mmetsp:Transcript_19989/g.48016  ORF Transcript_19989/g.48016 Transcript_19989/m.48016 type:complete len:402 (-) Transcript_19989:1856-3061(-)
MVISLVAHAGAVAAVRMRTAHVGQALLGMCRSIRRVGIAPAARHGGQSPGSVGAPVAGIRRQEIARRSSSQIVGSANTNSAPGARRQHVSVRSQCAGCEGWSPVQAAGRPAQRPRRDGRCILAEQAREVVHLAQRRREPPRLVGHERVHGRVHHGADAPNQHGSVGTRVILLGLAAQLATVLDLGSLLGGRGRGRCGVWLGCARRCPRRRRSSGRVRRNRRVVLASPALCRRGQRLLGLLRLGGAGACHAPSLLGDDGASDLGGDDLVEFHVPRYAPLLHEVSRSQALGVLASFFLFLGRFHECDNGIVGIVGIVGNLLTGFRDRIDVVGGRGGRHGPGRQRSAERAQRRRDATLGDHRRDLVGEKRRGGMLHVAAGTIVRRGRRAGDGGASGSGILPLPD